MAPIDSSYLEPDQAVSRPASNQPSSFFRTMLALAALDIVLLFWILNPLSKPSHVEPSWRRLAAPEIQQVTTVGVKPSPLGAVTKHASTKTRRVRSAGTYNPTLERRYVTVAYRQ